MALVLHADLQPTVRASSASRGRMRRQQMLRQRAGLGQQTVHLMGAYLWDPLSGACSSVHDAACDLREVSALQCSRFVQPWHSVALPLHPTPTNPLPASGESTVSLLCSSILEATSGIEVCITRRYAAQLEPLTSNS